AKQAALRRFQTRTGPEDPAFAERQAARNAVRLAREARAIEREKVTKAREIEIAERAAREAEAIAQAEREALERAREEASAVATRALGWETAIWYWFACSSAAQKVFASSSGPQA